MKASLSVNFERFTLEGLSYNPGIVKLCESPGISGGLPWINYQWAEVVYKYDLPFEISNATVYGQFSIFSWNDPAAKGYLDVSADGISWTTVETGTQQPWLTDPVDISALLSGSTTAYVRANLYQEWGIGSTAQAQFLRTDIQHPEAYQDPYIYEFRAASAPVPEPATMILLGSGLVGLAGVRKKLRRLQNAPLI